MSQKIVIDCDPGNDDIWAIISLLKCEKRFDLKLEGITCVFGNTYTENGCRNALLTLETFGRMDIPVYAGSESSLILKPDYIPDYFGKDGLKDYYKNKPSNDLIQRKHAVEALKELIENNPNEISVLAIGPLTNIALLYKLHPKISQKIKSLWIMGGNFQGVGNMTRCAEFNFWCDPEAAKIVLMESECDVTILPLETCHEACKATPVKGWRFDVLSSNNNPVTNFMDPVDKDFEFDGNFIPYDAYLIYCFLFPKTIIKAEKNHVTVELAGEHTRGQMIIDHQKIEKPNACIIKKMDGEEIKKILMWICDHDVEI